jgi:hypothetical protein
VHFPAEARFPTSPGLSGETGDLPFHALGEASHIETGFLKQWPDHPFILRQERGEQMGIVYYRVPPIAGQLAGVSEGLLPLDSQSFWADHHILTCA